MSEPYLSQTGILNSHDFTDTTTVEYSANQTSTTFLPAVSGYRYQITDVKIETKATTGQVKLYDDKSGAIIAILNAENNGSGDYHMRFVGTTDSAIEVTSTTGSNSVFILVNWKKVVDPTPNTSSTSTSTTTSTTTTSTSTS